MWARGECREGGVGSEQEPGEVRDRLRGNQRPRDATRHHTPWEFGVRCYHHLAGFLERGINPPPRCATPTGLLAQPCTRAPDTDAFDQTIALISGNASFNFDDGVVEIWLTGFRGYVSTLGPMNNVYLIEENKELRLFHLLGTLINPRFGARSLQDSRRS